MKTLILTFIITSFITCGTDQGEVTLYKYTVRNESGKNIKIKSYFSNYPNVDPLITNLSIGEELTKTYRDGLPPTSYYFTSFFGEENGPSRDSIKIIYENQKFDSFKREGCNGSDRNPLNTCIYRDVEEVFAFTQQDYENAQDCNGNCE